MFDFQNLFVFDMANNHQGNLKHALDIVKEASCVSNSEQIKSAIKLQFRDLDTFIHKDFINDVKNKNINRFLSTKLNWSELKAIKYEISKNGLLTMCTPFDEISVDKIVEFDFDLVKIASCSADDWPLLEKVSEAGKPIIISTGGLSINQIDKVVSFFEHKGLDFAIMHCVSIYPMPYKRSDLAFIKVLKNRYKNITIGWSTHEDPDDVNIIKIAYSLGARIYERHIGIENEEFKLNDYSSNPSQLKKWIKGYKYTIKTIGSKNKQTENDEINALNNLKRGIYLKNDFKKGTTLKKEDVFFSIPLQEGQLVSGLWNINIKLSNDVKSNEPLLKKDCSKYKKRKSVIKEMIYEIKAMLNKSKINLNPEFDVEFSHHYGVDKFEKFGATIINCINREYCKKILVQTKGQMHPSHYHKRKEETFHLLYGDLEISIDGIKRVLNPGETCLVLPGIWHSFETKNGAIIEEISTTHFKKDSVYKDPIINSKRLEERKTQVPNWGRYFI